MARCAPKAGETTAEVAAVHVLFHDMPDDWAPEAVLLFVAFIPDAFELVEVVLNQGEQVGGPRVAGPVDSLSRA